MIVSRTIAEPFSSRRATVLLAVLVVVVALTLAAYKFSDLMVSELRATNRILKNSQTKALADSGVNYMAAALANSDSIANNLNSNPFDNSDLLLNFVVQDGSNGSGRTGYFTIVSPDYTGEQTTSSSSTNGGFPTTYGVSDESGKINLNAIMMLDSSGTTLYNMLMTLPNMTSDIANSILDWMDSDETARDGGAESDYYQSLPYPYNCKDGPLDSLEELLLVKGVTPSLLYGNDLNRNGQLDPSEDDGSGAVDPGWFPYLTIYSREQNISSSGNPRIYVNNNDLPTLYSQLQGAVGQDLANYIIAYRIFDVTTPAATGTAATGTAASASGSGTTTAKTTTPASTKTTTTSTSSGKTSTTPTASTAMGGSSSTTVTGTSAGLGTAVQAAMNGGNATPKRSISSIYSLITSQVSNTTTTNMSSVTTNYPSPLASSSGQQTLLPTALDQLTTKNSTEIPARININTAPPAVLSALPGLQPTDVDQILALRPTLANLLTTGAPYNSTAWLLTQAQISPAVMQTLEPYITATTQVYRFQALGYFDQSGPLTRVEAVVDTNNGMPRIIYYRDLTPLGRAFDPRVQQQQQ